METTTYTYNERVYMQKKINPSMSKIAIRLRIEVNFFDCKNSIDQCLHHNINNHSNMLSAMSYEMKTTTKKHTKYKHISQEQKKMKFVCCAIAGLTNQMIHKTINTRRVSLSQEDCNKLLLTFGFKCSFK